MPYLSIQAEMLATSTATSNLPVVPGMPDVLATRQPIASGGVGMLTDNNVADLQGFLPHNELLAAKISMSMPLLLRHPKLSFMSHTFSDHPPDNMYV